MKAWQTCAVNNIKKNALSTLFSEQTKRMIASANEVTAVTPVKINVAFCSIPISDSLATCRYHHVSVCLESAECFHRLWQSVDTWPSVDVCCICWIAENRKLMTEAKASKKLCAASFKRVDRPNDLKTIPVHLNVNQVNNCSPIQFVSTLEGFSFMSVILPERVSPCQ